MTTTAQNSAVDGIMYERNIDSDFRRQTPMFRTTACSVPYVNKTASYAVTALDEYIFADATAGAVTITLPTAVPQMAVVSGVGTVGRRYYVVKVDASANAVTVATTSAQTINGSATASLASQYDKCCVMSNGTNWIKVA